MTAPTTKPTDVHHVEAFNGPDCEDWGWHCLTCGLVQGGFLCLEAAQDGGDAHQHADLIRQRDSARAWAVELEQRVDALLAITATMVALSEAKS